jgi:hypothetical protein
VSAFLDQTRLAEGEPFLLGYVTFSWKKLAQTASFVPKNFENVGRRGAKRAGDRSSKILRHKRNFRAHFIWDFLLTVLGRNEQVSRAVSIKIVVLLL